MTKTELRLEFKQETGNYPVKDYDSSISENLEKYDGYKLINYINWLEEEHIQLRNQLGINSRAKHIIKNMK
jgi:hypothetical protein